MRGVVRRAWVRRFGWGLGLLLLAGSLVWAGRPLLSAFRGLGLADASPVAQAAACVAVSVAATSLLFSRLVLLFPHAPAVPRWTMLRLVLWSGLLNSLPLPRAGLWGRAAYLKARHGLAFRDSLAQLVVVVALAGVTLGLVAGTLLLTAGGSDGGRLLLCGVGVAGLSLCGVVLARWWPRVGERATSGSVSGRYAAVWCWPILRAVDLAAAAARLVVTLRLVGVEASLPDALLLASGGLLVKLLGLTPNGIGLSEAATAAIAAAFTPVAAADAAAATLLDRAIEFLTVLLLTAVTGGWSGLRLSREPADRVPAG